MTTRTPMSARYPTDLPAWRRLKDEAKAVRKLGLTKVVARDKQRFDRCSVKGADLVLEFSRQLARTSTLKQLVMLARQCDVAERRDEMLAGAPINNTEGRAVLHTLLRAGRLPATHDLSEASREVQSVLRRMLRFVDQVHHGDLLGSSGKRFTDVVNIGIGGSDLGIVMAAEALSHAGTGLRLHAVSNVDGTQLADLQQCLDPETTLIVICSKTFTTLETMTNAGAAREWIASTLGKSAVAKHFAAASTNHPAMDAFDIDHERRFGFWDWVGGRYSLWSAVGLSIALAVGSGAFRELLSGARAIDRHFEQAPLDQNLPVLLAMLAVWNNNFLGATTHAVLPYDNRLHRLPAYLQQLQMESNGKSTRRDGKRVRCETGAVIWGEPGSNAQHSFYQLLHQGTREFSADFILPARSSGASQAQQDLAIANCLAQADAMAYGYDEKAATAELKARGLPSTEVRKLAAHKVHPGNHPSSIIMMKSLTPRTLGQLIALYEHKVFVEGVVWGINSFDQWGVELGKKMASALAPAVANPKAADSTNTVTQQTLKVLRRWRT